MSTSAKAKAKAAAKTKPLAPRTKKEIRKSIEKAIRRLRQNKRAAGGEDTQGP